MWCNRVFVANLIVAQLVKKIAYFLSDLKVHCHVNRIPPLDPILSQISSIHALTPHFFESSFNIILSYMPGSTKWALLFSFHFNIVNPFFMSHMHATCPAHHILLDSITLIMSCEGNKFQCSSLCNFLHPPVASCPLGKSIPHNTLFSNTLSVFSSLKLRDQVSHPCKSIMVQSPKKVVVAEFILLSLYMPGWSKGNHKETQSYLAVFGLWFELVTCWIHCRSANHATAVSDRTVYETDCPADTAPKHTVSN
jgi:hypothetical protein